MYFSDGSTVSVGTLYNNGSATAVNFTAVTTTYILFVVANTSSTTYNVGLAEFMAFGQLASTSSASASVSASASASASAASSAGYYADIAPLASVAVSSFASGQPGSAAIDTVCSGYSSNLFFQPQAPFSDTLGQATTVPSGHLMEKVLVPL